MDQAASVPYRLIIVAAHFSGLTGQSNSPPNGVGVAIRYWKRMREEAALHADDPRPEGDNPWQTDAPDAPRPAERPLSRLGDLGGVDHDLRGDSSYAAEDEAAKAARYNDWAERM